MQNVIWYIWTPAPSKTIWKIQLREINKTSDGSEKNPRFDLYNFKTPNNCKKLNRRVNIVYIQRVQFQERYGSEILPRRALLEIYHDAEFAWNVSRDAFLSPTISASITTRDVFPGARDIFKITRLRARSGRPRRARTRHRFSFFPQQYCNAHRSGKRMRTSRLMLRVYVYVHVCVHVDTSSLTRARPRGDTQKPDVCTPLDNTESQRTKRTCTSEWTGEWTNGRTNGGCTVLRPLSVPSLAFYPARSSRGFASAHNTRRSLCSSPWGTTACCEPVPDYGSYDTRSRLEKLG